MPTYQIISVIALQPLQKQRLAREITKIHQMCTGAPDHAVQVIFQTLAPYDHYHGGHRSSDLATPLIWLLAMNKAGRPEHVKQAILQQCRAAIAEAYGGDVRKEQVLGYMQEIEFQKGNHISSLSANNLKLKSKM